MNACCFSKETQWYYNNLHYHLAKAVIEKTMNHCKDVDMINVLNDLIMDFDDIFPCEENGWNWFFEKKMAYFGFIRVEDKKLLNAFSKKYYKTPNIKKVKELK